MKGKKKIQETVGLTAEKFLMMLLAAFQIRAMKILNSIL
jgi:hypothetical protein